MTGDYSRGAAGFWIENGEIAHPVEEVTIAGNLGAMLSAVADQVSLPIAIEIEPARHAPARHGALPYRRVNRATLPSDVLRKTDVNRQ